MPTDHHTFSAPSELWALLKPLAREMRHSPTPAEARLWQHLRNRQLSGAKFRRQHAIERFVVDFVCLQSHLIVEVDGPVHQHQPDYDAIRTAYLEACGFRVIRFNNDAVLNTTQDVLHQIQRHLTPPEPHPSRTFGSPSPLHGGEGTRA